MEANLMGPEWLGLLALLTGHLVSGLFRQPAIGHGLAFLGCASLLLAAAERNHPPLALLTAGFCVVFGVLVFAAWRSRHRAGGSRRSLFSELGSR